MRLRTLAGADEIWFEWMAGSGGGFAQPHIEYVRLNQSNLDVIEQSQIWNPNLAFNYASFTVVNERIGVALAFGGASDYGSSAVGIMGDGVVYALCINTANADRYGDYLTVRQAIPNGFLCSATVYCFAPGPVFDPRYVVFGRSADVHPFPVTALPQPSQQWFVRRQ